VSIVFHSLSVINSNGIGLGLSRALKDPGYRVAAFDLFTENLNGIESFFIQELDV